MATRPQDEDAAGTASQPDQPIKVGVMPLFSTWIYSCETGPADLNADLEALAHELMKDEKNATQRTNAGGWHYALDLFQLNSPHVADLYGQMEQHVQAYLNHFRAPDRKRQDQFRLQGWLNVNKAGDSNLIHCHPGAFLSGVYYVKVPDGMMGGEIVFRDPRGPAVAMYETPDIELPWVGTGVGIPFAPKTSQLFLFPSWLLHSVNIFEGTGERISIAFNASNP